MNEILKLQNVSLSYHSSGGETLAVKNLNFNVYNGEFISIIGPSGCGKSSVLSMIAKLIKPSSGDIVYFDNTAENTRQKLGYMLQHDELFPWRTIKKNVLLPLEINRALTKENVDYALSLISKYGLSEFINHYPSQLSGGMRQRVALIRTLSSKPELLLLDEPFSALDYQTRLSVCDDVYSILSSENKTTILVTHDISEAISLSDRIIVLTARPATIKNIHTINLKPIGSPLMRREHPDFHKWFEKIWRELNS